MSQYDITYHPRKAINGQALAEFVAEFTIRDDEEEVQLETDAQWKLFIDGASNNLCSSAGIVLKTRKGELLAMLCAWSSLLQIRKLNMKHRSQD